jgi:Transglycosylase SLT domain
MSLPWPWTINVEGKGYHFDSKAEAIAITQSFLAQGYRSIDVGCMQVNLKHHPDAFANLNQAFDPATNVAYSAKFLRTNYGSLGDWIKATAAYHSRTPVHGQRYLGNIERNWNKIVGKVAAARASKSGGEEKVVTATAPTQNRPAPEAKPRVISSARPVTAPQRVRVIQVSEAPRSNEVLVVRASAPVVPVVVAEAPAQATQPQGSSIRRVSLDNRATASLPVSQPNGPQFVFAN